eukprot:scaffold24680_cov221-Isochrysis_galbana.AAC.2
MATIRPAAPAPGQAACDSAVLAAATSRHFAFLIAHHGGMPRGLLVGGGGARHSRHPAESELVVLAVEDMLEL